MSIGDTGPVSGRTRKSGARESAVAVSNEADRGPKSFEGRYGRNILDRGIATFPSLILRWQAALKIDDGQLVTLLQIFSFYREGGKWPSVSIKAMAESRGVDREVVEKQIEALERQQYLAKEGKDPRFGSFFFNLSGLLTRLEPLVTLEDQSDELKRALRRLRRAKLAELATGVPAKTGPDAA